MFFFIDMAVGIRSPVKAHRGGGGFCGHISFFDFGLYDKLALIGAFCADFKAIEKGLKLGRLVGRVVSHSAMDIGMLCHALGCEFKSW